MSATLEAYEAGMCRQFHPRRDTVNWEEEAKGTEGFIPLNCSADSSLMPSADVGHRKDAIERIYNTLGRWEKVRTNPGR